MDVVVRDRVDADLAACVEALGRVHEADHYPREWPAEPASWLSRRWVSGRGWRRTATRSWATSSPPPPTPAGRG